MRRALGTIPPPQKEELVPTPCLIAFGLCPLPFAPLYSPSLQPRLLQAGNNFGKPGGIIRDDAIRAVQDFSPHVVRVIDRPRDDLQRGAVGVADKTPRGDCPMRQQRPAPQSLGVPDCGQAARCVKAKTEPRVQYPNPLEREHVKGEDAHQAPHAGPLDFSENPRFHAGRRVLDLDERQTLARPHPREDFCKQGNAQARVTFPGAAWKPAIEPGTRIEPAQHTDPMFVHPTAAGGRALEVSVVDDHGNAVGRELNVEFDSVRALAQSQVERRERVLRRFARRAPVADLERRPHERHRPTVENTLEDG
jgi:hypothetical protein